MVKIWDDSIINVFKDLKRFYNKRKFMNKNRKKTYKFACTV